MYALILAVRQHAEDLRAAAAYLERALALAEGLTYAEIAARLVVSVNTVRFHAQETYGKLGVNRQAQAVARARELDVL